MIKKVNHCRVCENKNIKLFLPLGDIPLPNGFVKPEEIKKDTSRYPLNVGVCTNCGLVQLMEIVNPEIMFRNYVYIPSTSKTRMKNFENIAEDAHHLFHITSDDLVIDIGSNDGSLLSFFKGYSIQTLGIDPAQNLAKIAELKGIKTINNYISSRLAKKIRKKYGPAKIITATNVVAHIADLHDLFASIETLLGEKGVFICEFPYLRDLVEKNQFDTIYHEHLSYFSIKPLLHLFAQTGLVCIDIQRTPIDGGSLRLFISKKNRFNKESSTLHQLLKEEERIGLADPKKLRAFAKRVQALRDKLLSTLRKLKKKGKTIAGYGAAAKGNILLNYCGITYKLIDFLADSTPYKQGLFTPGTHIPIYPEIEIRKRQPDYTLILAWNFAEEIINKQKDYYKKGGKFILPVPEVKII